MSALTATLCITAVSISAIQEKFKTAEANSNYEINFSSNRNKLTSEESKSGTAIVKTDLGSEYSIDYSNISGSISSFWQSFNENSSFSTSLCKERIHNNAFFGMKVAKFVFSEVGKKFIIYFSKDGSFSTNYSRNFVTKSGDNLIEFEGYPHYFKFEAVDPVDIVSLNISYTCDSSFDDSWDVSHGVKPTINDDTIFYGLYPKTIVSPSKEAELLSKLIEKATLLNIENKMPFWFENEYYVKDVCNSYRTEYYFSDGTKAVSGETFYFKCEPVVWNVCSMSDNKYTLDCSFTAYCHRYNDTANNQYVNSELRTWLNNDYYNTAFFLNSNKIEETNLSEIGELKDKIWVGSQNEYSEDWERYQNIKAKQCSDFAICNGAFMSTDSKYKRNSRYWTRTSYRSSGYAMTISYKGALLSDIVTDIACGIAPAITLKIN